MSKAKHYMTPEGQWKSERNLALQHRASMRDYTKPGVYMITLSTNGHKPLFGMLAGGCEENAYIELSPIGAMIEQAWLGIPDRHPDIVIYDYQIMPDHIPGIIPVTHQLERHLGEYIRGFKIGTTQAYRDITHRASMCDNIQSGYASLNQEQRDRIAKESLWERNYNDRLAYSTAKLEVLRTYIHDNPRRLWLKRHNPELFVLRRNITIHTVDGEMVFSAMGNMFLLNRPHKQTIICSRSITEDKYRACMRDIIEKAESGFVSISGCISKGEQQICRTIREKGLPLIILMKDGFPLEEDPHSKYFKPQGIYFEACAQGQLLLLEPKRDAFLLPSIADAVYRKAPSAPPESDRYRFLAINEMAIKI